MESIESDKTKPDVKVRENDKINDLNNKVVSNSVNHDVDKNDNKKVDDKVMPDVNSNSDSDAQCCAKVNNTESFNKLNDGIDLVSSGGCDFVDDERADEPIDDSTENENKKEEAKNKSKSEENCKEEQNKYAKNKKDDDKKRIEIEDKKEVTKKTEVEEKIDEKSTEAEEKTDEQKTEPEEKTEVEENIVVEEEEEKDKSNTNDSQVGADSSMSNDDNRTESTVTEEKKRKLSTDEVAKKLDDRSTKTVNRPKITNNRDIYCWRCHKDNVEANCSACPRAWHRKCIGGTPSTTDNWICGECASILQAENASTRSPTMAHITVDHLCLVLKYVIGCMKHLIGSDPFWNAVDLKEVPNYMDYVVKPMDLNLLEMNVDAKLYGSTDAFMADAKWIQHNCIVFNTCGGEYADTSKLTSAAKLMIKIARQEVSEYEACPDCYSRGRNIPRANPSWFVEACSKPHPLIWAKLKGFPFWPAKALPRINALGHVDVRFFGAHDRAWIAPKDIYLFSKEPPTSLPKKKRCEMIDCLKEINRHTKKLEMAFGPFTYAPTRTLYNPNDENQIKLLLPQYDPTCFYDLTLINQSHAVPQSLSASLTEDNSLGKGSLLLSEKLSDKELQSSIPVIKDSVAMMRKKGGRKRKLSDDQNQVEAKKPVKTRGRKKPLGNKADDDSVSKPPPENLSTQEDISPPTEAVETVEAKAVTKNNSIPESKVKSRKWLSKKFMPPEKHFYKVRSTRLGPKDYYDKPNNLRKTNTSINTHGRSGRPTIVRPYKHRAAKLQNSEQDKLTGPTTRSSIEEVQEKKRNLNDECIALNRSETNSSKYSSSVDSIRPDNSIEKTNNLTINSSNLVPVKRQSKAKKSFPNKPPQIPTRSFFKTPTGNNSPDIDDKKIDIPVLNSNGMDYNLPPPEAGPASTQLNRSANELVRQMARLMEEALKETAKKMTNGQEQANKFVFDVEIERMKWEHQQHLAEIKHNTDRTLREMRASLEVERLRAVEEIRKEAEDEKVRCIQETKAKQWCASCWQEALYYCCWNTSYCSPTCQQQHWKIHMSKCTQKQSQSNAHGANTHTNNAQQELVMPTLLPSAQLNSSNVRGA